jgi:hypothetical protein
MAVARKPAHVDANLRDEDLRCPLIHAGNGIAALHRVGKGREDGRDAIAQRVDRLFQVIEMRQDLGRQERVVRTEAPSECLSQSRELRPHTTSRRLGDSALDPASSVDRTCARSRSVTGPFRRRAVRPRSAMRASSGAKNEHVKRSGSRGQNMVPFATNDDRAARLRDIFDDGSRHVQKLGVIQPSWWKDVLVKPSPAESAH